uniref:uncharacterized protein LOC105352147 n=1 Tax=Fragaria vesca subsp. vesca TaxID=101020 RepID=UPI0005C85AB9|nr:PREDICTED: uncharacterized protein LOC105352147 [Fragaria vesca subsp. vesca]
MSSICEIIHNLLRHLNAPRKLSTFISGFVRKIISIFHGVLLVFRRRKAIEQQEGSKAKVTPFYPDTPEDDCIFCQHCNKTGDHEAAVCPNRGLMYCTVCRHIYPLFCKNPEEHGDKVEDYKSCAYCKKKGDHETSMCPDKSKMRVLVCSVCYNLYPCKNQEEHGSKGVEVDNFCCRCLRFGHMREECTYEYCDPNFDFE